MEVTTLRDRLLGLPQELYDTIYDFTFTVPNNTTIIIKLGRKMLLPAVMQVSHSTRQRLLAQYYTNNTFKPAEYSRRVLERVTEVFVWLSYIVPRKQRELIRDYVVGDCPDFWYLVVLAEKRGGRLWRLRTVWQRRRAACRYGVPGWSGQWRPNRAARAVKRLT